MKRWLGIGAAALIGLFSLYYAAFYAWVTATPLDAEELSRAQRYCYSWFALFVVSAIAGTVLFLRRR